MHAKINDFSHLTNNNGYLMVGQRCRWWPSIIYALNQRQGTDTFVSDRKAPLAPESIQRTAREPFFTAV